MRLARFALALVPLAALTVPALADAISDRQDAMDAVSDNMKVLVPMIRGERPFDGAAAADAGGVIADSFDAARELFPEDSQEGGDTRAKAEIWQDMAGFVAILDKGHDAATAVAAAGEAGDEDAFRAAFMQLGGACKDCHETFRAPKN